MARNVFVSSTIQECFDIVNEEISATWEYYGWQSSRDASWRIMQKDVGASVYLYQYGSSDYSTAWTNKESLTYYYPYIAYNK